MPKNLHLTVSESRQMRTPKIVIKIGGSLLDSEHLVAWLNVIAENSDGQVIIVPGGAVFADAVREAQKKTNVSDAVAHRLALLAMDQYGLLMQGLVPGLVTATSELEIAECGWQHRGIIWLPSKMVLTDEAIPQNWQVTSDSLSAWLANQLKAEYLILVKSKSLDHYKKSQSSAKVSADQLEKDELVDAYFAKFTTGQGYQTWVLNKPDYKTFEAGFSAHILKDLEEKVLAVSTMRS